MSISQQIKFPIWNKDAKWDTTRLLCWCCSLHGITLFLFPFWGGKGGKDAITFSGWWTCPLSSLSEYKYLGLRELLCLQLSLETWWFAQLLLLLLEQEQELKREQEGELDKEQLLFPYKVSGLKEEEWLLCTNHLSYCRTFFWSPTLCDMGCHCINHLDGNCPVGNCHNCVSCFDGGCSSHGDNAVVWTMAASNMKMSCFCSLWLFLLLELIKGSSRFVCSLALLKKGHEPKRVHGHCFVCLCKLKLMHLWHKKSLFRFLLHFEQLNCSKEESAIKVAEELHLMPHEFMHWHECKLLGNA